MNIGTLDALQAFLATPTQSTPSGHQYKPIAQRLQCSDGFSMSVQASESHYSEPRTNQGPYSKVEVWLCGEVPEWSEYGDGEDPYAFVPIELVAQLIDHHGGIKE